MTTHVDVLIPSLGRPSLADAERSARRALLPGDDIELHLHVVQDPDRRGPAWARNRAAEAGTAPWLALLDDDDLWLPGRLTGALAVLASRPDVALVCGDALPRQGGLFLAGDPRGSGRPRTVPPGDHTHAALTADCFVATSTVTLRRSDWESCGGMPEALPQAEDYALWLQLTRDGRCVHVLPDALCRLRAGAGAGLSDDAAAGARATREALQAYADPAATSPRRLATLLATEALSARRRGHGPEARALARDALARDPCAPLAWKAALRTLL
jgi:hypothetical protein